MAAPRPTLGKETRVRDPVEGLSSPHPGMESRYPPKPPGRRPPYPDVLPSVLVVDDNDQYRRVLLNYLELIRCASKGAANGPEALEILAQERIDLVVSGIKMEGMDGVELMQEAHQTYPQVPFIIMTGYALEYSYHDIINAGASDFIAKPFPLGELRAKIWRIQKEKDILRQLQHSLARLKNLIENTVGALASILEQKDPYTAGRQNASASWPARSPGKWGSRKNESRSCAWPPSFTISARWGFPPTV